MGVLSVKGFKVQELFSHRFKRAYRAKQFILAFRFTLIFSLFSMLKLMFSYPLTLYMKIVSISRLLYNPYIRNNPNSYNNPTPKPKFYEQICINLLATASLTAKKSRWW